jgi:hypothetical protein
VRKELTDWNNDCLLCNTDLFIIVYRLQVNKIDFTIYFIIFFDIGSICLLLE